VLNYLGTGTTPLFPYFLFFTPLFSSHTFSSVLVCSVLFPSFFTHSFSHLLFSVLFSALFSSRLLSVRTVFPVSLPNTLLLQLSPDTRGLFVILNPFLTVPITRTTCGFRARLKQHHKTLCASSTNGSFHTRCSFYEYNASTYRHMASEFSNPSKGANFATDIRFLPRKLWHSDGVSLF
jgi:hypothetical protein